MVSTGKIIIEAVVTTTEVKTVLNPVSLKFYVKIRLGVLTYQANTTSQNNHVCSVVEIIQRT